MNKEYVICDKSELVAVADAIREKTGSTDDLTVSGLADAVSGIEAGGSGEVAVPEMCTVILNFPPLTMSWSGSIEIKFWTVENNTIQRKTDSLQVNNSITSTITVECISNSIIALSGYTSLDNIYFNGVLSCTDSEGNDSYYTAAYYMNEGFTLLESTIEIYDSCIITLSHDS